MNKENFIAKVQELVATFERNKEVYKTTSFKEAHVRTQFIDPMFVALGWDMHNQKGYAEQYKEVVHEDVLKIEGKQKAPDYSFRIDGGRKFFLEAKKPFVRIKDDYDPAFQLRRYAWSAHLPISILTDFEEFAIYDTTIKPKASDDAKTARIEYFTYKDYLDKANWIFDTFSREAIPLGSFDKYVKKEKRGTAVVDKEFLREIESWRELLAKDIAKNNANISISDLNYSVQKIIDRIIFLRIAEDRGIEEYENLKHLVKNKDSYKELVLYFKKSWDKYDSGLFSFDKDRITSKLSVSDKVLDKILDNLYLPKSPYEFSVISVELLGKIYEQFLGKVIRLTSSHNAVVEEKPEVKKAGGVYYTPQYIVEYIVKNTVGELVKDKTPKQVEKLRIVDPACGSGSFLIGAYEFLLDWHMHYYENLSDKEKEKLEDQGVLYKKVEVETGVITWNLTTKEKKKIMLNNIYGVDIDGQAVEVTKLSLALKMLENENQESLGRQLKLFVERILPDLDSNIKCGNSLIGSDYFDDKNLSLLGDEEIKKVNAFDWEKEFKEVFDQGGFDAVIGNPPYLRIQGLQEFSPETISYLKSKYYSAQSGNIDIYVMFLEKVLKLINKNGMNGFILPHKFFNADMGKNIRELIVERKAIKKIISFKENQIFENATTYTCLLFLTGNKNTKIEYEELTQELNPDEFLLDYKKSSKIEHPNNAGAAWQFFNAVTTSVMNKLKESGKTLGDYTKKIFVGLQTSADNIYVLTEIKDLGKTYEGYSKQLDKRVEIEKGLVKLFLKGKDVHRYEYLIPDKVVIFPYTVVDNSAILMHMDFVKQNYPKGYDYLIQNKKILQDREKGKFVETWWQYGRTQGLTEFQYRRIVTPEISNKSNMSIVEAETASTTTVYSIVINPELRAQLEFILGILNSPLLWYFLKNTGTVLSGGYFRFKTNYLKPFPMPDIDLNDSKTKDIHDNVVNLVTQMLETQKQLHSPSTSEKQKEILQQRADKLDKEIDALVYELYGLTQEEIKIIESALSVQ